MAYVIENYFNANVTIAKLDQLKIADRTRYTKFIEGYEQMGIVSIAFDMDFEQFARTASVCGESGWPVSEKPGTYMFLDGSTVILTTDKEIHTIRYKSPLGVLMFAAKFSTGVRYMDQFEYVHPCVVRYSRQLFFFVNYCRHLDAILVDRVESSKVPFDFVERAYPGATVVDIDEVDSGCNPTSDIDLQVFMDPKTQEELLAFRLSKTSFTGKVEEIIHRPRKFRCTCEGEPHDTSCVARFNERRTREAYNAAQSTFSRYRIAPNGKATLTIHPPACEDDMPPLLLTITGHVEMYTNNGMAELLGEIVAESMVVAEHQN